MPAIGVDQEVDGGVPLCLLDPADVRVVFDCKILDEFFVFLPVRLSLLSEIFRSFEIENERRVLKMEIQLHTFLPW